MEIKEKVKIPSSKGEYVYFIKIGDSNVFKIGTTNCVRRRMNEHLKYYKEDITVLWVSPSYSKYTTLRIEDKMKDLWKTFDNWEYIRNDRFIIPKSVKKVTIKVRKEYEILL